MRIPLTTTTTTATLAVMVLSCLTIPGASGQMTHLSTDKFNYVGDDTIVVSYGFEFEPIPSDRAYYTIIGYSPTQGDYMEHFCYPIGSGQVNGPDYCSGASPWPLTGTLEIAASSLPYAGEYAIEISFYTSSNFPITEDQTSWFTVDPAVYPSSTPSQAPTTSASPTGTPTGMPTTSVAPSTSAVPTNAPTAGPSETPTGAPSSAPTLPQPTIAVSTSKSNYFKTETIEVQFDLFPARENVFVRLEGQSGDFIWKCAPGAAVDNLFCNRPNGEPHRHGSLFFDAKHLSYGDHIIHLGQIFGIQDTEYIANTTISLHPPTDAPSSAPSSVPSIAPSEAPSAIATPAPLAPGLSTGQVYTYTLVHTFTDLCYDAASGTGGETLFTGFPCPGDPTKIRWQYMNTRGHTLGGANCMWNRDGHDANWISVYLGSDVCGTSPTRFNLPMDTNSASSDPSCSRPVNWCSNGATFHDNQDCDGDGHPDLYCTTDSYQWIRTTTNGCQEQNGSRSNGPFCSTCQKQSFWCTHAGSTLITDRDCDGDGIWDLFCYDSVNQWQIGSASGCTETSGSRTTGPKCGLSI